MITAIIIIYGICMLLIAVTNMGISQACFLGILIFSCVVIEKIVDANKSRKNKKYREKGKTKKETVI